LRDPRYKFIPARTSSKSFFFRLCTVTLISFVGCQHLQGCLTSRPQAHIDKEHVIAEEAKLLSEAYLFVLDKYITPIEADQLVVNALLGMQRFLGEERLSLTREARGVTVLSAGETIKLNEVSNKTQGMKELGRLFSFLAVSNPQYSESTLAHAAIERMVRVDDWSDFMPLEDYKEAQRETQGKSLGTGAEVSIRKEGTRVEVVSLVPQSPADRAGILPRDQVIMINGQATKDLSRDKIYGLLRGKKDAKISLIISRKGFSEPLVFTITPEIVIWKNIRHNLMSGQYAYINIARFGSRTAADFDQAIQEMNKVARGEIKGIILDLRDSPGGRLDEVIEIASRFVKSGLIISIEGRQQIQKLKGKDESPVLDYPTVVLVNADTRAGAEIVAGVLQD
jgi:carboxyl-terminal processing protease